MSDRHPPVLRVWFNRCAHHACLLALLLLGPAMHTHAAELKAADIEQLRQDQRLTVALIVVVGNHDAAFLSDLARKGDGQVLVQGLSTDAEAVAQARAAIARAGLAGYATVVHVPDFKRLPYHDNLVSIVVADLDRDDAPSIEEVSRVQRPLSASWLQRDGRWQAVPRALPDTMGEWTHYDYDATGNPQSPDTRIGAIAGLQWTASDDAGRLQSGMRMAGGRVFRGTQTSYDSRRQRRNFWARDAFNGLPWWSFDEGYVGDRRTQQERTTVADDDRIITVFGMQDVATVRDARTGEVIRQLDQGLAPMLEQGKRFAHIRKPWGMSQLLLENDQLILGLYKQVASLDLKTGKRQWTYDVPEGQAIGFIIAGDDRVFVALTDDEVPTYYSYQNWFHWLTAIVALDKQTGKPLWTNTDCKRFANFGFLFHRGAVYVQDNGVDYEKFMSKGRGGNSATFGNLLCIDAATGKTRFNRPIGEAAPGSTFWHTKLRAQGDWLYPGFNNTVIGFSAEDGSQGETIYELTRELPRDPAALLGFCSVIRGIGNGQVGGKFTTVVDFRDSSLTSTHIARGGCDEGGWPAYGLVYSGSDGCGCTAHIRSLVAMHSVQYETAKLTEAQRLERGVAAPTAQATGPEAWPTILGDPSRSASTRTAPRLNGQSTVQVLIKVPLPESKGTIGHEWTRDNIRTGPITPPVIDGELAVVAVVDTHQVHAFSSVDGKVRWVHQAGGRITSSPTLASGMVVFGAHDGTVTALRASDGALVWRRLIAPDRRQLIATGQVESVWPVHGSVIVRQGKVFAAAGRHTQTDGGIHLVRLDLATGTLERQTVLDDRTDSNSRMDRFSIVYPGQGQVSELLVMNAADTLLFHGPQAIDPETLAWVNIRLRGAKRDAEHERPIDVARPDLWSFLRNPSVGFIDRRTASHGTKGQNGYRMFAAAGYEEGIHGHRILRRDREVYRILERGGAVVHHELNDDWSLSGADHKRRAEGKELAKDIFRAEQRGLQFLPDAAVLAGDTLILGGGARIEQRRLDGTRDALVPLPSPVVIHGLAVSAGTVYASLEDGSVVKIVSAPGP